MFNDGCGMRSPYGLALSGRLALSLLLSVGGCTVSPKVLFSEVRGSVLWDGVPVSGAAVVRSYSWGDKQGGDATVSDAKGEFQLPPIVGRSLLAWLPHEPMVHQTITIQHQGTTYEAWSFFKHNYDLNGELDGRPLRLRCDLTDTPSRITIGPHGQSYFGLCSLD